MADRSVRPAGARRPAGEPVVPAESYRVRTGVKALVRTTDSVLLVRERHADGSPFWTLPGGGVLAGEDRVAALRRELDEELRCRCVVDRSVTWFPYVHASLADTVSVYDVYECRLLSRPTPVDSDGITDVTWTRPGSEPSRTLPQVRRVLSELSGDRPES